MKKNSLSFKIISRILLSCLVLGLIIFSVYYYFTRTTIERTTRENAIALAENTIKKIEEVIKPAEMIPNNLAWIIETGSIHNDSIFSFLYKLVKNNPSIYASAIAFEPHAIPNGQKFFAPYAFRNGDKIETTSLGSADYNYFIMDWYQIPATLKRPYWSEPYFDEGGGKALLSTYSVPFFFNKNGQRVLGGIITIDISLDWLTDIVNSVKIFETGYAFLISGNGVYVTHPNRSLIMNETIFTRAKELDEPRMREIGRDMIHGKSNLSSLYLKDVGNVWIYHTRLPSAKWALGVVYPHEEMFASLHKLNILIFLLSLGGLALLVFFTVGIINRLLSPLTKFAKSARLIAQGNFNTELPQIKTNDEMKELHDSFEFMQKELANYIVNLKETTSAKEKIESELRIAKEIQMGMIPHIFPPFPNLPEIDLFASLESAKEVGGDLYDFFLIDEYRLCFAIGDVSGKGIPASLFMAVTRTLLRSVADKTKNTAEIVSSINKTLSFNNESNMFVTFFLGILDIRNGELKYCNAGHNPPVLIRNRTDANYFKITKAIPVGLFDDFAYTEESIFVEAGDQVFLYTDGLTEAEDVNHRLFGEDRLLEVLRKNAVSSPKLLIGETIADVSRHVNGYVQSDDLTMMSIIYNGRNAEK
ncbi:MAG: SpoIIE family protein phosphatase [Prolixibacteraceae bacterium]|jgi:sigma-B regulation protein RsbU (phosphoserine phosphatase)|nr:SpoIIE family protein phosphatase [Prolixibacteraceae bacterium]